MDGAGNLFIADTYNNSIRKADTNDIIATVAGNGTAGYSGDGGPATSANLNQPAAVAVDALGNLFIADTRNNLIREVLAFGPTLTITNVGMLNSGNYDLVVTSPYGSVTSAVFSLTVSAPLSLTATMINTNSVLLQASGFPIRATCCKPRRM